jgi:uncharacterized membrane protein
MQIPFSLFHKKAFFTADQAAAIVATIREAEKLTSGEIRLFVETKCKFMDPMDRAKEVFKDLNMSKTLLRNGVLIYIATKDKEMCIYGDIGIHQKVSNNVWTSAIQLMQQNFSQHHYVEGLVSCVNYIGTLLEQYFPYDSQDKNELPDNIVFGK